MTARVGIWVKRELGASVRTKWFVAYLAVFLLGGFFLTAVGVGDTAIQGYRGFARSFVGLIHLTLFFVPLMALFPAVSTIADERESGALDYFLSQPVTFGEVYLGKWWGTAVAILLCLTAGLALGSVGAIARGVPPGLMALLYVFVVLLALTFVSLGLAIAALVTSRLRATTIGVLIWLFLVAFGTLGVIAAFVKLGLPEQSLILWSFANPVEAFRLGIISSLDPDLSLLGPLGASVLTKLGASGTIAAAAGSLALWALLPGVAGWWFFRRVR